MMQKIFALKTVNGFLGTTIVQDGILLSKAHFIDENRKDISGGYGYRLNIVSLSEQSMTLNSNVSVDGKPVTIVYEFSKK